MHSYGIFTTDNQRKALEMLIDFREHLPGCVPGKPCHNCQIAAFLRARLSDSMCQELCDRVGCNSLEELQIDLGKHVEGCTPLKRCSSCYALNSLREFLGSEFTALLNLYDENLLSDGQNEPQAVLAHPAARNLDRKISDMEFSTRVRNMCIQRRIITIRDLAQKTERDLLDYPNFGRKSLNEIKEVLFSMGLRLGMDF